jgi:hypothetical protein
MVKVEVENLSYSLTHSLCYHQIILGAHSLLQEPPPKFLYQHHASFFSWEVPLPLSVGKTERQIELGPEIYCFSSEHLRFLPTEWMVYASITVLFSWLDDLFLLLYGPKLYVGSVGGITTPQYLIAYYQRAIATTDSEFPLR